MGVGGGSGSRGPDEVDGENGARFTGSGGEDSRGIGCGKKWVPGGHFTG